MDAVHAHNAAEYVMHLHIRYAVCRTETAYVTYAAEIVCMLCEGNDMYRYSGNSVHAASIMYGVMLKQCYAYVHAKLCVAKQLYSADAMLWE